MRHVRSLRVAPMPDAASDRVPPGQYVIDDFPVLSAGPTPHTPLDDVDVHGRRRDRRAAPLDVGRVPGAAARDDHGRHPLRHQVVEARHDVGGRLGRHAARRRRDVGRVRRRVLRRRLHDEPAARGRHRRQGVGRVRLRRRAARARARRPGAAARAAPLLLEEREVGARARRCATRTSPASGSATATTTTATRGGSSATGATDAGRVGRRVVADVVDETPRARDARPRRRRLAGHRAGQHVDVRLTAEDGYQAQRSYSIASAPERRAARAHRRAPRRRRGVAVPRRRAAARRQVRAARADRRLLRLGAGRRRPAAARRRRLGRRARCVAMLRAARRQRRAARGCSTRRARSTT